MLLVDNLLSRLGGCIISVTSERKVTVGTNRITAEGCTIEIEAEAGRETVIDVANGARGTHISVRSCLLDSAGSGNIFDEERLGLG